MALAAMLALPVSAHAAFPGANGKISFIRDYTAIWTMSPTGADQAALNDGFDASWSPDGSMIAFSRGAVTHEDIWVMNADGSNQRRVTTYTGGETHPNWSPDGRKLVFERIVGDYSCDGFLYCGVELFTTNLDGTDEVRLTDNQTYDQSPSWSPEGTKIAFSRFQRGSCFPSTVGQGLCAYDIVTINPDRTGETVVLHNPYANRDPDWSPDGSQIALTSTKNACCVGEIFTMNADGTGLKQLTFYSQHFDEWGSSTQPAWSPDGTKIAFEAGYRGLNHSEIHVVNSDGSGVQRLTNAAGVKFGPDWQPIPNRPPDCSGVVASRPVLTTVNRRLVPLTLGGAIDPDGDPVTLSVDGVTQDEPVVSSGDPTAPDAVDEGEGELRIRAERNPHGDGRVYRVAFTVAEDRGGSCSGTATVSVPRKKRKPAIDSAPPSYDSFGR